jgi:Polyketide cyclase / dehydrase and lipid transport
MCRPVEPTCPARLSWLRPRYSRHCRSFIPNGLACVVMTAAVSQPTRSATIPSPGIAAKACDGHAHGMTELSTDLIVAAPADQVWEVIGPGFDRIGAWATAIPTSTDIATPPSGGPAADSATRGGLRLPVAAAIDAPVVGRVCSTGIRLVPEVTETLIAYDQAGRTLTYQASGMPAFVALARNTWTVTPIDAHRCRVSLRARLDTHGVLGLLARWVILAQTRRTSRHLADDLRHYVETGTPSPRKQRQQRRAWHG